MLDINFGFGQSRTSNIATRKLVISPFDAHVSTADATSFGPLSPPHKEAVTST